MVFAYNEFNKSVDEKEITINVLLINLIKELDANYEDNKEIYEKLNRNISLVLKTNNTIMSNNDYCRYLNQWIYHSIKKNNINENLLGMFYVASQKNIVGNGGRDTCSYFSYATKYENPLNIIKLENMHYNIDVIQNTLKSEEDSVNSCQRYICECYKIYQEMYKSYCPNKDLRNEKGKNTCDMLDTFNKSYMSYLFDKEGIKDKIPSLLAAESVPFSRCPTEDKEPKLSEGGVSRPGLAQKPEQRPAVGIEPNSTPVVAEQSDNSIPFNTTSVVSAMAGIPPFIALIYKFTPVGTMFRRKNNKNTNVFNNLDEEIEKELFYRRLGNVTINSTPERYNVAYGPV
ncbi:Plasmodium vivax Vir protein, putative [Plasmodium vivax]|uniref:Vir protein, putative n=1 Tax=Plasmodium vivax TaxID=5855 RepID=A0A1G4GSB6_PLAVI|nr:Plasmodium vivax Vir protein, putative [Plasmodium vivax]